eukprot:scaffold1146_cov399-Prasinococcus_capsulatus_cf.AAC.57
MLASCCRTPYAPPLFLLQLCRVPRRTRLGATRRASDCVTTNDVTATPAVPGPQQACGRLPERTNPLAPVVELYA